MNDPSPHDPSPRRRPSFKRLIIVLAFCLLLGAGIQFVTAINDNSTRNVITLIACGIAIVSLAIWAYRTLAIRVPRSVAALLVLVALLIPVAAFRIRGFTGEIVPILELRFSGSRQLLTEVVPSDPTSTLLRVGQSDFPEFLGPQRNAVIARREFDIPARDELQPLWTQTIGEGWAGFAIVGDRCVTLEQRGQQECVTCYRLSDGALLWINRSSARHENRVGGNGPRSTPTIADGRVYTQGATGIVQCLDLSSGELIWRQELLRLAGWSQSQSESAINWGRAGSPLLVDQLCILPFGGPGRDATWDEKEYGPRPDGQGRSLIALDRTDGTVRWTSGEDQISFASPMLMTLAGTQQIVSVNEKSVSGHAIDDGRLLWSTRWSGESNGRANCAAALAVDATAFLVGKAYGTGSGVFEVADDEDGFTVAERWKRPHVLKTKFTHACVAGGFAYGLSDGMLECVDLANGQRAWAQPRGARYGHGQVILVDDVLVVQTESGEIAFVAARTDSFEELATLPGLSSKTWNVPAVAGRYLAVRNDVQARVYRLPQRGEEPLRSRPGEVDEPGPGDAPREVADQPAAAAQASQPRRSAAPSTISGT